MLADAAKLLGDLGGSGIEQLVNRAAAWPLHAFAPTTTRHRRVMDRLIVEHRSLFALMRELERVASQASPLTAGDYCLARDIVAYVHDYSDNVHHPTEDLVFARLLARRPAMEPTVQRLRGDHEAMAVETWMLFKRLDALATRRAG